jgi:hypothetical protein
VFYLLWLALESARKTLRQFLLFFITATAFAAISELTGWNGPYIGPNIFTALILGIVCGFLGWITYRALRFAFRRY